MKMDGTMLKVFTNVFIGILLFCSSSVYAEIIEVKDVGIVNTLRYEKKEILPSSSIKALYYHEDDLKLIVKVRDTYYMYCDVLVGTVFNFSTTPLLDLFYAEHIEGQFTCKESNASL